MVKALEGSLIKRDTSLAIVVSGSGKFHSTLSTAELDFN